MEPSFAHTRVRVSTLMMSAPSSPTLVRSLLLGSHVHKERYCMRCLPQPPGLSKKWLPRRDLVPASRRVSGPERSMEGLTGARLLP